MHFRLRKSAMSLGLVLTWLAVDALAQNGRTADAPRDVWSFLRFPAFNSRPPAKGSQQPLPAAAMKIENREVIEAPENESKPAKKPAKIDNSAFGSQFSATSSNRRSAIVKQAAQAVHEETREPESLQSPPSVPVTVTPHWTPKFVEQAACVMSDDEVARPVAVNMAGELLSQRITPAKAVVRMDATLSVVPPAVKQTGSAREGQTQARSASEGDITQARSASEGLRSRKPSPSEKNSDSPTDRKAVSGRPAPNTKLATAASPTAAH